MSINDIVIVALIIISVISGFASGFIKKSSKIASLAVAGIVCFYLGGTISSLMIDHVQPIRDWLAENDWGAGVVLIIAYVVTFLVSYIIMRIVLKGLSNLFEASGVIGRFLDKGLGLVWGLCIGFVLADVYVWILYGLSCVSPDIATWVLNDAKLTVDGMSSLTGAIMQFNLRTIGATFPGLM